jgi:hypothetical protein
MADNWAARIGDDLIRSSLCKAILEGLGDGEPSVAVKAVLTVDVVSIAEDVAVLKWAIRQRGTEAVLGDRCGTVTIGRGSRLTVAEIFVPLMVDGQPAGFLA